MAYNIPRASGPSGAGDTDMKEKRKAPAGSFISNRFAVVAIAILFGASLAGWIMTELVPPDFPERSAHFREAWGKVAFANTT